LEGGIASLDNSVLTVTGGTVRDNRAITNFGGGMYLQTAAATLSDVTVMDNAALFAGGGVAIRGASVVTMTGVSVSRNAIERMHLALCNLALANSQALPLSMANFIFSTKVLGGL
jgi:hypothetical protein